MTSLPFSTDTLMVILGVVVLVVLVAVLIGGGRDD